MSNNRTIKTSAETFTRFLRARAAERAAKRAADKFRAAMGLPEAGSETAGEYIIVDGNNNPLGKFTVSGRDGYEVKPGWVGKVS